MVSLFVSFTLDPMLSVVWRDPAEGRFARVPWLGTVMAKVERGVEWLHHRYGALLEWALEQSQEGARDRARDLRRRASSCCRSWARSSRRSPTRGARRSASRRRWDRASSTPTPRRARWKRSCASTRIRRSRYRQRRHQRGPQRRARRRAPGRPPQGRSHGAQKDFENEVRKKIQAIPGIELSVGYNRPIWINLLGPSQRRARAHHATTRMAKMAKIKGIVDLESSLKANNPAITIKVNNELASDLGLTVSQIGSAVRPFVAGDVIGHWLGSRRAELRRERAAAQVGPAHRRGPGRPLRGELASPIADGTPGPGAAAPGGRVPELHQPADHQAPGPAAPGRASTRASKAAPRATWAAT